jgi:hypothetical protein
MDRRRLGGVQASHRPSRGPGVGQASRQTVPDGQPRASLVVADVPHAVILHEPTDRSAM